MFLILFQDCKRPLSESYSWHRCSHNSCCHQEVHRDRLPSAAKRKIWHDLVKFVYMHRKSAKKASLPFIRNHQELSPQGGFAETRSQKPDRKKIIDNKLFLRNALPSQKRGGEKLTQIARGKMKYEKNVYALPKHNCFFDTVWYS